MRKQVYCFSFGGRMWSVVYCLLQACSLLKINASFDSGSADVISFWHCQFAGLSGSSWDTSRKKTVVSSTSQCLCVVQRQTMHYFCFFICTVCQASWQQCRQQKVRHCTWSGDSHWQYVACVPWCCAVVGSVEVRFHQIRVSTHLPWPLLRWFVVDHKLCTATMQPE